MPARTSQLTSERRFFRPFHLSDSTKIDLARLKEDNLNEVEYRACLTHWTTCAAAGYPKMRGSISAVWCRDFVSRLTNSSEFSEIVKTGMTRKVASDRRVDYEFRKTAGGDPLFYLNLNGVPPVQVLYAIQDIQARVEKLKTAAPLAKELESKTTQAIARLRNALSRYDQISPAGKVEQALNLLESEYTRFAAKTAGTVGLKSPGKGNKRRMPLSGEFIFAAQILRATIHSEMNSWTWGEPQPPTREASRRELLLPVIACILKAAWPMWLKGNDAAAVLRKVKTACPTKSREPFTILLANYPSPWSVDGWVNFIKPHLAPLNR